MQLEVKAKYNLSEKEAGNLRQAVERLGIKLSSIYLSSEPAQWTFDINELNGGLNKGEITGVMEFKEVGSNFDGFMPQGTYVAIDPNPKKRRLILLRGEPKPSDGRALREFCKKYKWALEF